MDCYDARPRPWPHMGRINLAVFSAWQKPIAALVILVLSSFAYADAPNIVGQGTISLMPSNNSQMYKTNVSASPGSGSTWGAAHNGSGTWIISPTYNGTIYSNMVTLVKLEITGSTYTFKTIVVSLEHHDINMLKFTFAGDVNGVCYGVTNPDGSSATHQTVTRVYRLQEEDERTTTPTHPEFLQLGDISLGVSNIQVNYFINTGGGGGGGGTAADMSGVVAALSTGLGPSPDDVRTAGQAQERGTIIEAGGEGSAEKAVDLEEGPTADAVGRIKTAFYEAFGFSEETPLASGGESSYVPNTPIKIPFTHLVGYDFQVSVGSTPGSIVFHSGTTPALATAINEVVNVWRPRVRLFILFLVGTAFMFLVLESIRQN